ncbi:enoyl-CoA hydratase/isomerase family protein [Leptospira ryugenii]|uniref:Enoyl-CoA hydratase/isomerase family protein n=1 Tax=Leptospira ryugenii TaxID=1917863 RepID=A0A2P2E1H2_9LEPT|nr:crotonase/enoyl-CoA hydratase family protein [Leptospira ryugenii]GBF50730.1 enoyl-CoA hydratase/isomerase family protein [Leptospira ryugenii]
MEFIQLEYKDKIMKIGLDRPDTNNAFHIQMLHELTEAFTLFEEHSEARVAILHSTSKHFTVGLEIEEVTQHLISEGKVQYPENSVDPHGLIGRRRSKPLIVAISGFCFTIGLELALAADIRIGTRSSRFTQAEVQRGFCAMGGATFRMVQEFGWGNAMRYLLTGDVFNGEEAYRLGLLQELVEPQMLLTRAEELAKKIEENAPSAILETIRSAHSTRHYEESEYKRVTEKAIQMMRSPEGREGILSFQEKRKANFG